MYNSSAINAPPIDPITAPMPVPIGPKNEPITVPVAPPPIIPPKVETIDFPVSYNFSSKLLSEFQVLNTSNPKKIRSRIDADCPATLNKLKHFLTTF